MSMDTDQGKFTRIRYELPEPAIARVVMAKPETRNAQDHKMLYEIEGVTEEVAREAFRLASAKLPVGTSFVSRTVM